LTDIKKLEPKISTLEMEDIELDLNALRKEKINRSILGKTQSEPSQRIIESDEINMLPNDQEEDL
jgi:hypothetical protein